jgi:hypothetical protein
MSDVAVIENRLDAAWNVHFQAMAARRESLAAFVDQAYPLRSFAFEQDELRMWQVKARWPAQDFVEVQFAVTPFDLAHWPLVAWHVAPGQKVSAAMVDAGVAFALATGKDPMYAFTRAIPAQAGEGMEVQGIMLVQADWVPNGFLAVGRGGMQSKG